MRAQFGSRALFPDLEPQAYLAHAAISPPSTVVQQAIMARMSSFQRHGAAAFGQALAERDEVRAGLGQLIGADADDIALIQNTTDALRTVAFCMPFERGDRVLLFEGEFPANVTPFQQAAELFDLELEFVPLAPFMASLQAGLMAFESALKKGARLVSVSAVQFQTGLRMPLRAMSDLCRSYGAELCVDGIQACGATPIDVEAMGIDYLACGGHKWLMGVEGVGFLYVRRACAERLVPRTAGWLSHENGLDFLFKGEGHLRYDRPIRRDLRWVEGSALSALGVSALNASVTLLNELGVDAIHAHVNAYLDALEPQLLEQGFRSVRHAERAGRSCTLSLRPPHGTDATGLYEHLLDLGISVSVPDGYLRFAPHFPNHQDEITSVISAVRRALKS